MTTAGSLFPNEPVFLCGPYGEGLTPCEAKGMGETKPMGVGVCSKKLSQGLGAHPAPRTS
jgi:hypothetical protein